MSNVHTSKNKQHCNHILSFYKFQADQDSPRGFSHTFVLRGSDQDGEDYYIKNELFRHTDYDTDYFDILRN